jgi:photosystem II stability/assembly factor-like uncharacterized protein
MSANFAVYTTGQIRWALGRCPGRILEVCVLRVVIVTLVVASIAIQGSAQHIEDDYGYEINGREVADIFFLDATRGWMIVQDHLRNRSSLLATDNGGKTWKSWQVPNGIRRVFFLNAELGWAIRSTEKIDRPGGAINLLRSSDAGKSWESQLITTQTKDMGLNDLGFVSDKLGWMVGIGPGLPDSGLVLATSDGGRSAHRLRDLNEFSTIFLGVLVDKRNGVWIYGPGAVVHSGDEGKTWSTPINLDRLGTNEASFDILSGFFLGSGRGWLAGLDPDGIILGTRDFGKHWNVSLRSKTVGYFSGISFWDDRHGCAVSVHPTLLFCTEDAGAIWKDRDVLPADRGNQAQFFTRLIMLPSGRGWILRAGGYLYETSDAGRSWREVDALKSFAAPGHE